MRASRLLSILILLQLRGRMSAEALAAEFEVSVRTIYRDIDHLSAAGVPVYAERGRAGGFALLDGYRTRLTGFTAGEAEALLLAGSGAATEALGIGADAAAAQLKLMASLPPDVGASARRVAERFHLDPVQWSRREDAPSLLPRVAEAVWRERQVRMRYESWKGDVLREVDPLGLVLKGGAWYLVAAVGDQPRTYRVSSIHALEVLDRPAQRPRRFDLVRYWRSWSQDFETRLAGELADVRVSREGRRLMRDFWPAAFEAVRDAGLAPSDADWIRARIPVEAGRQGALQVLRLGADIEVIGPPDLREAVRSEAARISGLHASRRIRPSRR
jgi:predicted DNA-binding transcriptional regulator YafY